MRVDRPKDVLARMNATGDLHTTLLAAAVKAERSACPGVVATSFYHNKRFVDLRVTDHLSKALWAESIEVDREGRHGIRNGFMADERRV